jgi:hypothetical protein
MVTKIIMVQKEGDSPKNDIFIEFIIIYKYYNEIIISYLK